MRPDMYRLSGSVGHIAHNSERGFEVHQATHSDCFKPLGPLILLHDAHKSKKQKTEPIMIDLLRNVI
ncbi:MAG: hypothetical protein ACI959_000802 [Limisphaerales bacterium]